MYLLLLAADAVVVLLLLPLLLLLLPAVVPPDPAASAWSSRSAISCTRAAPVPESSEGVPLSVPQSLFRAISVSHYGLITTSSRP